MGLPLVAAGQLAFSFYNVVLELLAPAKIQTTIPMLEIVAVRFLITYLGCVAYLKLNRIQHPFLGPPGVRGLLLLRGITGFLGVSFAVYHSLGYLTLSDSTTLSFLTPCLTGFMGHLFLGEPFTPRELLSALTSLIGVVFITKPHALFGGRDEDLLVSESGETFGAGWGIGESKFAIGLGLLGVVSASAAYTIIAAIGRRSHPLHIVAAFSGSSVVASVIGMVVFQIRPVLPPTWHAFFLLLSSGFLALCGQVLIAIGLQGEKAGRGSLVLYLQVIFSGLVDRLVLTHAGQHISILSILGSAIILSSAYFGTFANTVPAVLFSPLPMPASSPKVPSSGSIWRPASGGGRERRDSLSNKRSGSSRLSPARSFASASSRIGSLITPALEAWQSMRATLGSLPSSQITRPTEAGRTPRRQAPLPRKGLFPPAGDRPSDGGMLELELAPEDRWQRPVGGAVGSGDWSGRASVTAPSTPSRGQRSGGQRSGRQSPRMALERIETGAVPVGAARPSNDTP